MNFLKKKRRLKLITALQLGEMSGVSRSGISCIENDTEALGEVRAKRIADALGIPEDVMTVYGGRLPSYAKKTYREKPDKLEKIIRKGVERLEDKKPEKNQGEK